MATLIPAALKLDSSLGRIPESACVGFSLRVTSIRIERTPMGRPIEITRFDLTATELRELAAKTQDGAVVRRLLAIALVLEGYPREAAALSHLVAVKSASVKSGRASALVSKTV